MATQEFDDSLAGGVLGKCSCMDTLVFTPKSLIEPSRHFDALLRPSNRISTNCKVA